ncbi:MAG: hypothetical protein Q8Q38_01105 [bacterium]|nr:hypothetical protein [bacterium]
MEFPEGLTYEEAIHRFTERRCPLDGTQLNLRSEEEKYPCPECQGKAGFLEHRRGKEDYYCHKCGRSWSEYGRYCSRCHFSWTSGNVLALENALPGILPVPSENGHDSGERAGPFSFLRRLVPR